MSLIFATIPGKRLAQGITSASSTFYINNILGFDGLTNVDDSDLGTQHYCVFRNDTGTVIEIMEIDPTTISSGPITIVRRGLSFYGDRTTETTALKLDWPANSIVQLGTDAPQIFQYLKEYIDAASIAGAVPASTTAQGIVEEATQAEVDARTTTGGTGAKLFAPLDKIRASKYHDYAADAGSTDAYAITVTPAPTAYSAGQIFAFKANTINTGPCTLNVNSLGAKDIKRNYNVDPLSGEIKANQDVIVIYDGTNFQVLSPTTLTASHEVFKFGGTGADGDLSVSSGTTTIDLGGAQVVTKNYNSISITGTGVLAFSNPHSSGTIIILKSRGDVTITSSTVPCLDTRGMGAAGGGAGGDGTEPTGELFDGVVVAGRTTGTSTGGVGGVAYSNIQFYLNSSNKLHTKAIYIVAGAGGGGGRTSGSTGGTGGRGGGALLIQCAGALNFTGTIDSSGTVGGVSDTGSAGNRSGGAGGGGAAGMVVILYNTLTANSGTITATGGAGGAAGTGGGSGGVSAGGGGGAAFLSNAGGAGGNAESGGAAGTGVGAGGGGGGGEDSGAGPAGGAGGATAGGLVAQNTEFI